MIYINGEHLSTTASKPFVTTDEWLVGKIVAVDIKEITNITGTYIDSFVQSVIREDEVNFRIVIKNPSTSHSAFQVKIDYVTNTNVAKSETFWQQKGHNELVCRRSHTGMGCHALRDIGYKLERY